MCFYYKGFLDLSHTGVSVTTKTTQDVYLSAFFPIDVLCWYSFLRYPRANYEVVGHYYRCSLMIYLLISPVFIGIHQLGGKDGRKRSQENYQIYLQDYLLGIFKIKIYIMFYVFVFKRTTSTLIQRFCTCVALKEWAQDSQFRQTAVWFTQVCSCRAFQCRDLHAENQKASVKTILLKNLVLQSKFIVHKHTQTFGSWKELTPSQPNTHLPRQ